MPRRHLAFLPSLPLASVPTSLQDISTSITHLHTCPPTLCCPFAPQTFRELEQSQAKSRAGEPAMKDKHKHKPPPPCTEQLSNAMGRLLHGAAETCSRDPRRGPQHVALGLEGAAVTCKAVGRTQLLPRSNIVILGRRRTCVLEKESSHWVTLDQWGNTGMASQRMDVEAGWTVDLRGGGLDGGCPRIWLSGHKVFPAWCLSMKHFAGEGGRQEEERGKPGAPRFGNPHHQLWCCL